MSTIDWATNYTLDMAKCPPGCTCGRHAVSDERRQRISAKRSGRPLSDAHRAALKCAEGCTCGKHTLRNAGQYRRGSAGFVGTHSEATKAKLAAYTGPDASAFKHGWSQTPTYKTWSGMWGRCTEPGNASYSHYGARGITVCERWRDFTNFLADMGPRPEGKTLDRIDNDGNYEPGNCRWATRSEQNANQRDPGGWKTRRRKAADE